MSHLLDRCVGAGFALALVLIVAALTLMAL